MRHAERFRERARRSSAASASVNSSSSPSRILSSRCTVRCTRWSVSAVLGEVVGADLLGALAGADLRAPRRGLLGLLPLALGLEQPGAQHAHRLRLVLELRFLVLHRDDDPCRHVRDPHRRVGRVHALAARAGRAVDVDLEVVRVDLDLDLLGLGHDRDRRGRGVDPPLRLGLGNALDAVRAGLPLEDGVGAVALDREHDLLEAARLVAAHLELLDLVAAGARRSGSASGRCRRPRARPRRRRRPGGSRRSRPCGRPGRSRRARASAPPRASRAAPRARDDLAQVAVVARGLEVVETSRHCCASLYGPVSSFTPPPDLGGLAAVVVDRGIAGALLRLAVGALELVDRGLRSRPFAEG